MFVSILVPEEVDGEVPVGPGQSELDGTFGSGPLHIPAGRGHHLPDTGARGREQQPKPLPTGEAEFLD